MLEAETTRPASSKSISSSGSISRISSGRWADLEAQGAVYLSAGELSKAEELWEKSKAHKAHYGCASRYAMANIMRLMLAGDRNLADACLDRVSKAEDLCSAASDAAQKKFSSLTSSGRSSIFSMLRTSSYSHPWSSNTTGNSYKAFSEEARSALAEWRRIVGMQALMYLFQAIALFMKHSQLKGALALRSSWLLARNAPQDPVDGDPAQFAQLVRGVFLLMLSNLPPFMQKVFSLIGFESDKEAGLAQLTLVCKSSEYEPSTLGTIILSLHHLMLSQQEYNDDIKEHMEQAHSAISKELARDPQSILARLVASHILRRRGELTTAMQILDDIGPKATKEVDALGRSDIHAYRMQYDRATLHMVGFEFNTTIELLEPLAAPESTFGAKVLATALLSACYAMKSEPDNERAAHLIKVMGDEPDLGRMDQSILLKQAALMRRTHKQLLGYEILYIFGHLKCYSPVLGKDREANLKWLNARKAEVLKIAQETGLEAPRDLLNVPKDANPVALEELAACTLVAAHISALCGDLATAEADLEALTQPKDADAALMAALAVNDMYAPPWAMYEMAAIKMRQKKFEEAKELFERSARLANNRKRPFSFSHMLSYKCAGGLRECKKRLESSK
mmetsp:Transcript_8764/g.15344  ORF Transcript_8764/g.15344 Transcript_8764/m.15344 type:complete len:624 (+) Transcript_8764:141-2012(+)